MKNNATLARDSFIQRSRFLGSLEDMFSGKAKAPKGEIQGCFSCGTSKLPLVKFNDEYYCSFCMAAKGLPLSMLPSRRDRKMVERQVLHNAAGC